MYAKDVLDSKNGGIISVKPDETLQEVLRTFARMKIGFAIVRDMQDGISGTISERDICHAMSEMGEEACGTKASQIMTQSVVSCKPDDVLPKIMALMTAHRTRHVLVMDGETLRGIVSIGDVVKHRLDESLRVEESMRDYIEGTGYSYHPLPQGDGARL